MGNSATCLGPNLNVMTTFPAFSSITESLALEQNSLEVRTKLTNYVATAASLTPGAGPFLYYIIAFLGSTDFSDIGSAYGKAQINEAILKNQIHQYNSELLTIKNSLERLNRTDLNIGQLQSEIVYALRRSEYLYNLFKDEDHLFYKYPLVSMPYFARITTILWATINISSKLDPTMLSHKEKTLKDMASLIQRYVNRFLEERLANISWNNCGFTIFSKQCLIYDRPWMKKAGEITNYFLTAYQFNLPLNQNEWRDGIVIRTPNGCRPEERDYPTLLKYKDSDEYKSKLKESYLTYFRKIFPVEF